MQTYDALRMGTPDHGTEDAREPQDYQTRRPRDHRSKGPETRGPADHETMEPLDTGPDQDRAIPLQREAGPLTLSTISPRTPLIPKTLARRAARVSGCPRLSATMPKASSVESPAGFLIFKAFMLKVAFMVHGFGFTPRVSKLNRNQIIPTYRS